MSADRPTAYPNASDRGQRRWWRRLLILPPVVIGVAVFVMLSRGGPEIDHGAVGEAAQPVRVIEATPTTVVPRAVGYGLVSPAREFRAVAQVPGRVVFRADVLEQGRIVPAGTEIIRLDPADAELTLARLEAELERIRVQQEQLDLQEANLRASLALEAENLALAEQNVERRRTLVARGTGTQADLERAESDRVRAAVGLQSIENELALLPAERRLLQANLAQAEAQRDEAALDLERTRIATPLTGRVASVAVDGDEYVGVGAELAVLEGIDRAEISARLSIDDLFPLIGGLIDPALLTDLSELSRAVADMGLTATVRLAVDGVTAEWEARVDRLGDTVDPATRTVGVVVAVDNPYGSAEPGQRPPLANGLFVEVVVEGPPRPDRLVVPRTAVVRDNLGTPRLYVVDGDGRLAVRTVTVGLRQDAFVVIDDGLSPGDRVIVSDVAPASDGMAVSAEPDPALAETLARIAAGGEGGA